VTLSDSNYVDRMEEQLQVAKRQIRFANTQTCAYTNTHSPSLQWPPAMFADDWPKD